MSRRWTSRLLAAVLLLASAAGALAQAVSVQDDSGATITLPQPAQRIISLAPNLTEIVFATGAGERLIGVGRFSDYPEAAQKIPVVSDAFALNLESINALKPDLILVWKTGTAQRQRDALKKLAARMKVPVFESEIRDVAGIGTTLLRLGTLTGTPDKAAAVAARVDAEWKALVAQYRGAKPVRVFYQVWDKPLMTFNDAHLVGKAIAICGGINGFGKLSALTPMVSREAVLAWNPQLILASTADPALTSLAAWRQLPTIEAVRHQQLAGVRGEILSRMGPRFVQGARELCEVIDKTRKQLR